MKVIFHYFWHNLRRQIERLVQKKLEYLPPYRIGSSLSSYSRLFNGYHKWCDWFWTSSDWRIFWSSSFTHFIQSNMSLKTYFPASDTLLIDQYWVSYLDLWPYMGTRGARHSQFLHWLYLEYFSYNYRQVSVLDLVCVLLTYLNLSELFFVCVPSKICFPFQEWCFGSPHQWGKNRLLFGSGAFWNNNGWNSRSLFLCNCFTFSELYCYQKWFLILVSHDAVRVQEVITWQNC